MTKPISFFVLAIAALSLAIAPAHAKMRVDVELVLLADASQSIDDKEIALQRQGYATALQSRNVLAAIKRGYYRKIAITFIEWADEVSQDVVVPWMVISDKKTAAAFAQRLLKAPRRAIGSNAIGSALLAARNAIRNNAYDGARKVIDFSADSANSFSGPPISMARSAALADKIIINGLAILCRATDCSGQPVWYDLEKAFKQEIIGGPGSFVVTVDGAKSFTRAVRRKLILELSATTK